MALHATLLRQLLPSSYDTNGRVLAASITAEGAALDAAVTLADTLLTEADPKTTTSMLPEFERVFELLPLGSVANRQTALAIKMGQYGGQSRNYFAQMAERAGFVGTTVDEFAPATCNGTCNDALYSQVDKFCWRVNIPNIADSSALQAEIAMERPAHTNVIFRLF